MSKLTRVLPILLLVGSTLVSSVPVSADEVIEGFRSLNNESKGIDYKISQDQLKKLAEDSYSNTSTTKREIYTDDAVREIKGLIKGDKQVVQGNGLIPSDKFKELTTPLTEESLSWLVEHDIISRDKKITLSSSGYSVERDEALYDQSNPFETISKSNFLMGIYKAVYGVIPSRPLNFAVSPSRDAKKQFIEWKQNDSGEWYTEIDYGPLTWQSVSSGKYLYVPRGETKELLSSFNKDTLTFVSPNVFELYLYELINKGIVSIDTVSDMVFKQNYEKLGDSRSVSTRVFPMWSDKLSPAYYGYSESEKKVMGTTEDTNSFVLGRSYKITAGTKDLSNTSFTSIGPMNSNITIEYIRDTTDMSYFADESLSSMEALKFIEKMLRVTEKDMTETEARIVAYKYGANFSTLTEEDRKTVEFLVAKGILNFEDPTEYRNLYGVLTKEFAYKLMYRLANKDARLNFSEIQLTDSDNFWIDQGFVSKTITFNYLKDGEYSSYVQEDGTYPFTPIPEVETESVEKVDTASVEKKSTFAFGFFTKKSGLAAPTDSVYTVKKVFDNLQKYTFNGVRLSDEASLKKQPMFKSYDAKSKTVVFEVKAASPAMAVGSVDSRIAVGTDYMFSQSGIKGVTKYDDESGKTVTLIPASTFNDSTANLVQKIVLLDDKVLKNQETGTMAVLLPKSNTAIVGSHIITGKELMVKSINGEIYYNLEIIKSLLSNSYISQLDPNSIYISKGVVNERLATIIPSTGNSVGKTYVAQFRVEDEGDGGGTHLAPFVNISQLSNTMNFMIKDFELRGEDNKISKFKVVIKFSFVLPDKNANFTDPIYKAENPNFDMINDFLYERPEDPELRDWWDNNIEISNAFVNTLFETKGVKYIKSGYLVPSVDFLYDDSTVMQEKKIQEFLIEVGSHLSSEWVEKFVGSVSNYNKPVKVGDKELNTKKSEYYPFKELPTDLFPRWAHAMFNTVVTASNSPELTGSTNGRKNTSLWRYLMSNRTLSYSPIKSNDQGVKIYVGQGGTFAVTNGGAVYRLIEDNDTKFPAKLVGNGKVLNEYSNWGGITNFQFKPQTRTASNSLEDWIGKTVKSPNGDVLTVSGVSGTDIILTDTRMIVGSVSSAYKGTSRIYEFSGSLSPGPGSPLTATTNLIKARYNQLRDQFVPAGKSDYSTAVKPFEAAKNVTAMPPNLNNKDMLFVDKNFSKLDNAKTVAFFVGSTIGRGMTYNEVQAKLKQTISNPTNKAGKVGAYVSIRVSSNYWSISETGNMIPRKTSPFLQVGNIYFSGLNQTLIDSMIYKEIGAISVNKIKDGATLVVGDIVFVKRGDRFVSQPQENMDGWKSLLKNAESSSVIKSSVFSNLVGQAVITGKNDGVNVNISNIPKALTKFVSDTKLDVPTPQTRSIKILGGDTSTNKAKVYTYKSDGTYTVSSYSAKNIPIVNAVVFSLKFDDILLARKINEDGSSYQMMMSNSSLSEGYNTNIPFFSESLSISDSEDVVLLANRSTFRPLGQLNQFYQEYRDAMSKSFKDGVLQMIRMILLYGLSAMITISTLMFFALRLGGIKALADSIRYPNKSDKKGPDIFKWMTFGLYSLDSKMSVGRLILVNLCTLVLIVVIVKVG